MRCRRSNFVHMLSQHSGAWSFCHFEQHSLGRILIITCIALLFVFYFRRPVKLTLRCPSRVGQVTVDPQPDFSFDDLRVELNSLEEKLKTSSTPFTKTPSRYHIFLYMKKHNEFCPCFYFSLFNYFWFSMFLEISLSQKLWREAPGLL